PRRVRAIASPTTVAARRGRRAGDGGCLRENFVQNQTMRRPCAPARCREQSLKSGIGRSSPRPISTAQLKGLLPLHLRPINQLVSLGSYPVNPVGDLILEWASHLDAFSAYPIRTWLPSDALGRTTGALAVRPTRSSRTKVSSPQISCAHSGYDPNCLTTF